MSEDHPVTPDHYFLIPTAAVWARRELPPGLDREQALRHFRSGAVPQMRRVLPLCREFGLAIDSDGVESRVRLSPPTLRLADDGLGLHLGR